MFSQDKEGKISYLGLLLLFTQLGTHSFLIKMCQKQIHSDREINVHTVKIFLCLNTAEYVMVLCTDKSLNYIMQGKSCGHEKHEKQM